ncbi:hypothetical protein [Natronococcus occultus]|uniref:Uncharacterized protein n=1 Tax=Natronococcus occultus SP4 TaxID=694430 RepID=L0JXB0_9EURY|nr:hypothetical protein [Natronococcus occultus]AGB37391.1 hypothetical protein Natoc_1584 [Natronococcus occultus SP4]
MTDEDERSADGCSGAPIDFDRLDAIRERFAASDRFERLDGQPAFAPERLVCVYDRRFYPERIHVACLEVVWFENGDFSLHYHEEHDATEFDHRWDRHPSNHNSRDHVHPGPDAPTPGDDTSHPEDWRDVLSMALSEIEARQRAFWEP